MSDLSALPHIDRFAILRDSVVSVSRGILSEGVLSEVLKTVHIKKLEGTAGWPPLAPFSLPRLSSLPGLHPSSLDLHFIP